MQIILASESPRRKEILDTMGISYIVLTESVEEITRETQPEQKVQALAKLKSEAVRNKLTRQQSYHNEYIIIGADTMVFYKEHALGKPKSKEDAARMLRMLSGQVHQVITGVSILIHHQDGQEESISLAVATKVIVRTLSEQQISEYIETGEPMDKAGAYAIQGKFGIHVQEIIGDYYNIVGFPIARIYEALLQKGIDIKNLK